MTYTPNFNDPRIRARCLQALNFVELYAKTQAQPIATTQLYLHFGNTSRSLGRWLLEHLLVVKDSYYNMNTGVCKKYTKNTEGVRELKSLLGLEEFTPEIPNVLEQQILSGDFEYEEKSQRLFNPLQYVPRRIRSRLLANKGYRYHYDIKAAAPTLLYQYAQKRQRELKLLDLEDFILNRSQRRQEIAQACEITEDQAKTVINALLQGGVISAWTNNKIFQDLEYNHDAVIKLNHNTTVKCLKEDIKSLWGILREELPVRYITDRNGRTRRARVSGSDKSELYRRLEKQVGDVIRRVLKKHSVKALWIHDGWVCDEVIDPSVIVNEVRRQTGFVIELDWTIYED